MPSPPTPTEAPAEPALERRARQGTGRQPLRGLRAENCSLTLVHETPFDGIAIVVSHEVQHTVCHEQLELGAERNAEPPSLAIGAVHRDHDLAHVPAPAGRFHGKRENVRASRDTTPDGVQPADLDIIDDEDFDVAAWPSQDGQGPISRAGDASNRERTAALAVDDDARH